MLKEYTLSKLKKLHTDEADYSAVLIDEGNNQHEVSLSRTNTNEWIAINREETIYPLLTKDGDRIKELLEYQSVFIAVAIPKSE